uniref:Uncharacterized protein n=1 Tax=Hanusia phi TaxID=3032 RepID=A0A7S0EG25_9CRYP|mmetsp:Transcript_23880/g.53494  ORF Transcript_23880/g.53494 Transcript_23880/m.53494 type:complete len:379 (+) Transcript_23880:365-1501(+)
MVSYVNTKNPQDHKKAIDSSFVSHTMLNNNLSNNVWGAQNIAVLNAIPYNTGGKPEKLRNEDFIPSAFNLLQSLRIRTGESAFKPDSKSVHDCSPGRHSSQGEVPGTSNLDTSLCAWESETSAGKRSLDNNFETFENCIKKQKTMLCKSESESSLCSGQERVPKQALSSGSSFLQFLEVLENDGIVVRHFGKVPSRLRGICGWTVKERMMEEWHKRRREWFMAGKEGKVFKPNSFYQILRRLGFFPTEGTKRASHGLDFEGSRTFWWDEGLRNKYTHRRISQSSHVGHAEGSAVDSENSFPSSPQAGRDSPDTSSLATDRRMAPGPSLHPADLMSSSGVSMDGRGNIFIVDLCSHGIRKITPRGVVSVLANKISPVLR